MQAITLTPVTADLELDVYLVLTILSLTTLGALSAVSVFMSGFTGEPLSRIAAKAGIFLVLILIVLFFFQ